MEGSHPPHNAPGAAVVAGEDFSDLCFPPFKPLELEVEVLPSALGTITCVSYRAAAAFSARDRARDRSLPKSTTNS